MHELAAKNQTQPDAVQADRSLKLCPDHKEQRFIKFMFTVGDIIWVFYSKLVTVRMTFCHIWSNCILTVAHD